MRGSDLQDVVDIAAVVGSHVAVAVDGVVVVADTRAVAGNWPY